PERLAAGRPELLAVDLFEQRALVELDGTVEIPANLAPPGIEDADLGALYRLGDPDQIEKPPPAGLEHLELRMMEDRVELFGQQPVNHRDVAVEGGEQAPTTAGAALPQPAAEPHGERLVGRRRTQERLNARPVVRPSVRYVGDGRRRRIGAGAPALRN